MDDGKRMANTVWIKDRKSNALEAAQYRSNTMVQTNLGSSMVDSPFLEWVIVRPAPLERGPISLPQKVALQITYLTITLIFVGVAAWAGYITGA
tara:strand:- start:1070 stop:1351 length:282 start_codon:yes stop_codon:yes gene_type:complete